MTTTSPPTPSPPASVPGPDGRSRRRRLGAIGAGVVTLLVLAVAYAASDSQPTSSPGAAASTAGSASTAATAFTATTLTGDRVTVPGSKPSVVFFFSATCTSCGPGARALAEAQTITPGANYVAVDIDPSESETVVRKFLTTNEARTLAYSRDTDAKLAVAFKVTQLSTAIVLDASGAEVSRVVHPTTSKLRSALAEAGAE